MNAMNYLTDSTNRNGMVRSEMFKPIDVEKQDTSFTITTRETNVVSSSFIIDEKLVGVLIPEATTKGYAIANEGDSVNLQYPESGTRRGRVGKQISQTLLCSDQQGVVVSGVTLGQSEAFQRKPLENLSRTLKCHDKNGVEIKEERNLSIRKLTPRECGRLMGVSDEDISKMELVNSNAQLYKQFGNSIVVDVLVNIFKQLF